MASRMVANTFDDDLNPANGDPMNYGAGPVVQFQGGNPTLPTASQQLIVPATPVYKPKRSDGTPGLELNYADETHRDEIYGDMVAGTYTSNPAYDQQSPTPSADEDNNYNRRDFLPHDPAAGSTPDPAFLVRMRRTPLWNVPNSLDNTPGISSAGPPLPVLFGRGSLMAQTGSAGQLSVASGITVRAAAIAATAPAQDGRTAVCGTASIPGPLNRRNSQIPLADGTARPTVLHRFQLVAVELYPILPKPRLSYQPRNGYVQAPDGTTTPCGYVADGSGVDLADVSPMYPTGRPWLGPAAIMGDQAKLISLDPSVSVTNLVTKLAAELSPTGVAYLPIVDDTSGEFAVQPRDRLRLCVWLLQPMAQIIIFSKGSVGTLAAQNASATLGVALPAVFADPTSGSALTTKLFTSYASINNLVLAPVLMNHYIGPNQTSP